MPKACVISTRSSSEPASSWFPWIWRKRTWRAERFGKGHPAGLNYGDCFAYALATVRGEALLYKGDDFARTDVVSLGPAARS